MQKFHKILDLVYYLFKFGNSKMAMFLAKHAFPGERINEIAVQGGKLLVKKTGQMFSIDQLKHCQESLGLFLTIATHPEIKIDNSKEGELTILCGNTRIKGDTFDNFYVVQELFADGVYSIHQKNKKVAVVDVGMNVGVASLYFAGQPQVSKVYGFEPFPETYQRALNNFQLNPDIKNKIVPHNAGVGGADAELEIPLIVGESAVMSTSDFFIQNMKTDQTKTVKVGITDIKKILPEVFSNHPNESIILKLDCEGAEYDIIEQMHQTGMIRKISVIVIEWHMKGYQSLNDTLVANDFCTTVFPRPNAVMNDTGMIYAVNTRLE